MIALLVVAICLIYVSRKHPIEQRYLIKVLSIVTVILCVVSYLLRGGFSITNSQPKEWLELQFWAKNNTNVEDQFIVPPLLQGFRSSPREAYMLTGKMGHSRISTPILVMSGLEG